MLSTALACNKPAQAAILAALTLLTACAGPPKVTPTEVRASAPAQVSSAPYRLEIAGEERLGQSIRPLGHICGLVTFHIDYAGRGRADIRNALSQRWPALSETGNAATAGKISVAVEKADYRIFCAVTDVMAGHCVGETRLNLTLEATTPGKAAAAMRSETFRAVRTPNGVLGCASASDALGESIGAAMSAALSELMAKPELNGL